MVLLNFLVKISFAKLGLSYNLEDLSSDDSLSDDVTKWTQLEIEARPKSLSHFPQLANLPHPTTKGQYKPSPTDSIMTSLPSVTIQLLSSINFLSEVTFELQSVKPFVRLPISINSLGVPPIEERQAEIPLLTASYRRRYSSNEKKRKKRIIFQLLIYTNKLIRNVNLSSHRKRVVPGFIHVICYRRSKRPQRMKYMRKHKNNTNTINKHKHPTPPPATKPQHHAPTCS